MRRIVLTINSRALRKTMFRKIKVLLIRPLWTSKKIKRFIKKILLLFLPKVKQVSAFSHNDIKIHYIYPASEFKMPLLKDVSGDAHPLFGPYSCSTAEAYVIDITNGRCICGREEVSTSENYYISEITSQKTLPRLGRSTRKNVRKIKGSVAYLALSGLEDNYYHFCVEWLSRLHLIRKSMLDIDFFIVPRNTSFQRQYIDLLGIDQEKILNVEDGEYIEAEHLIVPSLINNWEHIKYREHGAFLKQWLPTWIGNVYEMLQTKEEANHDYNRKVYISRSSAAYRKIDNETVIEKILTEFGFSTYRLEEMTVKQQIELFKNAECIVSIHGAGLVNMSYSQSTATILELFPEYYHDAGMRIQAVALGHRYEYLIGKTPLIDNIHPQQENVYIDPIKFERAMLNIFGPRAL